MITEHNGFKLGDRVVYRVHDKDYAGTIIRFEIDEDSQYDVVVAFDHIESLYDCNQWAQSCDLVKL